MTLKIPNTIIALFALLSPEPTPADFDMPEVAEDVIIEGNIVIVPALPTYGTVYGEVTEIDFEQTYPYTVKYRLPAVSGVHGLLVRSYAAFELVKVS